MEQLIAGAISGGSTSLLIVYLYTQLKIKEAEAGMRKELDKQRIELYSAVDKSEKEANKYTDAKTGDLKEMIIELKQMVAKIQDILINKQ